MKTTDKIIQLLKVHGELNAKTLADELGITTMGVRQHLQALENTEEVIYTDRKVARGRPARYWSLTTKSHSSFDDRHEELTVQLIDSVREIFGECGLDDLITHREQTAFNAYQSALQDCISLQEKLETLARLRSDEGYMATIQKEGNSYWLLENHCPICAAASHCLNFCRSELSLFQQLFQEQAEITREEHIIEGARRCAYRVKPFNNKYKETGDRD